LAIGVLYQALAEALVKRYDAVAFLFLPTMEKIIAITIALFFSFVLLISIVKATNEAAAFNRFTTGPKATAWDALFVELRVEAQCNNK
jgi:L-asparagine transporter-like permease